MRVCDVWFDAGCVLMLLLLLLTEDRLHVLKVFKKFGKVVDLNYMWHHDGPRKGQPRGYCFVEFARRDVRHVVVCATGCFC